MRPGHLQKHVPVALYYQLSEQLRQQIETGQLAPGERIPSVQELAAHYSISPMTAQRAIRELQREGLLEGRRGIGTFVAAPKLTVDLKYLTSFGEDVLAHGLAPHGKLLTLSLELPPPPVATRLDIGPEEPVVHIERLRFYGETPAALEESFFPACLCPGLEELDVVGHSLYVLLEGHYHLRLDHSTQVMEAAAADLHEARLLGIAVRAPVALVRGVTYLVDGRPIEDFCVVYRGDRFCFQLQTIRLRKEG